VVALLVGWLLGGVLWCAVVWWFADFFVWVWVWVWVGEGVGV